jgi:hypothetical protein
MSSTEEDFKAIWDARYGGRQIGHAHFWERALTRGELLGTAAGAVGVAATAGLWSPAAAKAAGLAGSRPRPIPGGTTIGGLGTFHFFFPEANPFSPVTIENNRGDPSSITDFNGFIGVGDYSGGTGMAGSTKLFWQADLRFMKGRYVGEDGNQHRGAFAFV